MKNDALPEHAECQNRFWPQKIIGHLMSKDLDTLHEDTIPGCNQATSKTTKAKLSSPPFASPLHHEGLASRNHRQADAVLGDCDHVAVDPGLSLCMDV